jgi:hypothetical protein
MIEFRDFYYCIATRAIYKEQYEYYTYLYSPEVSLDNLSETMSDFIEHSIWIKYLKASYIYNITDIALMYVLSQTRKNAKGQTVATMGESDSGKSKLHRPFRELHFPHI